MAVRHKKYANRLVHCCYLLVTYIDSWEIISKDIGDFLGVLKIDWNIPDCEVKVV
jgi:hypothetical protein